MRKGAPDLDAEARKIFAALGLSEDGASTEHSRTVSRYSDLDAVWQHPTTGAKVYIGNATASKSPQIHRQHRISHIVNCTTDMPNAIADGSITYFRFNIYAMFSSSTDLSTDAAVRAFFADVFRFTEDALAEGRNVLIHCLAGAHRAGTTGTAFVMYATGLRRDEAIRACKAVRPAVDPFGNLYELLGKVQAAYPTAAYPQPGRSKPL